MDLDVDTYNKQKNPPVWPITLNMMTEDRMVKRELQPASDHPDCLLPPPPEGYVTEFAQSDCGN